MSNEEQEAVTVEQDEAAFEAGFAEARGEESPTEQVVTEAAAEPEAEPEAQAAPEPEILFAGLTEEQLKSQLAKAGEVDDLRAQVRRLDGRYGELNSRLQQSNQPMKISADKFARLRENYGDLADALAEDLSQLSMGGGGGQQAFDSAPIEQKFSDELAKIRQENERKLLTIRHRDWETIKTSDDYKLWEQTIPAEERQKLNDSWDEMYIADRFDDFKGWRTKSQEVKQSKQGRLAAAVTPTRGAPAAVSAVNDEAAFEAGFRQVRR